MTERHSNSSTHSQEGQMTRHDRYIGVIGFSVIAVAIGLGGSSFV
jgi:hypothetical protein